MNKTNYPSADRNRLKFLRKDILVSERYKLLLLEAEKIYTEVLAYRDGSGR